MQSNKKKASRKPKSSTTIVETVHLGTVRPRRSRRTTGKRTGPRAFQQPNPKTRSAPPRIRSSRRGDVAIIPGNDLIATIAAGETKISAGDVLVNVAINPEEMKLPRLSTMSRLYRRFRITSMSFEYEPTAVIQPGSLLGFVDYDSFESPATGTPLERLQYARATYGEKGVNITNRGSWKVEPMKESLFIHEDLATGHSHWHDYARFVIYANSDIAPSTPCGSVVVKYTMEFSHPTYEAPPTSNTISPIGYGFKASWNATSKTITAVTLFDESDLKVSIATPLSGNDFKFSFPYNSVDPSQNYYMVNIFFDQYSDTVMRVQANASSEVGVNVIHYVDGSGSPYETPKGYPTAYLYLQTTASSNYIEIGCGTDSHPNVSGSFYYLITRAPVWVLSKYLEKKSDKEIKKSVLVSDTVVVPSQSSSSSVSVSSGSYLSQVSAPTPQNSPTVSTGWFRS